MTLMIKKDRHISYCLIASLLMVACDRESHPITPEEQPQEQYAISLSASSTAMTNSRAIVDSEATLQATTLGVFAYKQLADGTKVSVFDNTEVSYDAVKGWTYTGTKYWDRTAHYYFVSYSPHQDANINFSEEGRLEINNIPNWQAIDTNSKDYVVADDHGKAEGGYITANGVRAVPLNFKHILCQLEVRVAKNAFLTSEYTLSGISYTNVPKIGEKAKYTYLFAGKDESGAAIEEAVGTMTLGRGDVSSEAQQMAKLDNVIVPSDPDEDASTTIKHLVVPFETNENIKITLGYKVNGTERPDAVVDTQIDKLVENKRYVLTLTFNSGAEVTSSLQILDWVDEEIEEPKYNW